MDDSYVEGLVGRVSRCFSRHAYSDVSLCVEGGMAVEGCGTVHTSRGFGGLRTR